LVEDLDRTCPGQLEVPTPREQKALAAMRSIKDQVRPLKDRLVSLEESGKGEDGESLSVKEELSRLKEAWNRLEAERKAAAKERMIILGHEEAD